MAVAKPESCEVCHGTAGADHQGLFNSFTDGLNPATSQLKATINSVKSTLNADNVTYTSVLTFTLTKGGAPFTAGMSALKQKSYSATQYDPTTQTFATATAFNYSSPAATGTPGQYTVTNAKAAFAPELGTDAAPTMVYAYFGDTLVNIPVKPTTHYNLMDNVASVAQAYGTIGYTSTANVSGCEKCHPAPYSKHGYRQAHVAGLNDFVSCKSCHTDQKTGGDGGWYLLADDPATYASENGTLTTAQTAQYAYTANLMNDVHNSHAFEFAYPQSMSNCSTCHAGNLNLILTDANFTITTCKSCHPVTGTGGTEAGRAPALTSLIAAKGASVAAMHPANLYTTTVACSNCHNGTTAPSFSQIHTGYNAAIYADNAGTRYSDAIKASIDAATVTNNVLDVQFSATGSANGLTTAGIVPTVLVSLYGYDTKDFIVSAHNKDIDTNRNLEWQLGSTPANPRFTIVTSDPTNGKWEVKVDLSAWASKLADGSVKRAEIAVLPTLKAADGTVVAVNAPSKTFNLTTNAFETFFKPIVDANKCNTCHDALATTFHSGDRGGNVVVCRICHTVRDGAAHYEMQGRSIDSYIHAIHTMQNPTGIKYSDPIANLRAGEHVDATYPSFTTLNCESCHNPGTYDVPDQSKSLPGILSKSEVLNGKTRTIGSIPSYVTGPASRACGACHRAEMINEDNAGNLAAFDSHTDTFGYMLDNTTPTAATPTVLDAAIQKIMSFF
jgi:OmcA/MtrC family decaheme c-type cytochrome